MFISEELKTRVKVLIVDDHRLFRDGLKLLIAKESKYLLAGEAENGIEAVDKARIHQPDVILMDIAMPELNGIEATRKILIDFPQTKIIMLTQHTSRQFVIESLKAGALGYVLKNSSISEVIQAIEISLENRIYLSEKVSDLVISDYIKFAKSADNSVFVLLSAREREVLQLVAEGKSTKEIAAKLNVSVKTIETHRKQIMTKLNIHSVAELTKYAIREGLTQLS